MGAFLMETETQKIDGRGRWNRKIPRAQILASDEIETSEFPYRVYLITNTIDGKRYVGQTRQTLLERWWKHKGDAYNGAPWHLSRAIQRYGPEAFKMETLFAGLTKEEADLKEVETIKSLNLRDQNVGYNMTDGGDGGTGCFVPKRRDLDNEELAGLYQNGTSISDLAKKFSASTGTIWKRLGKMGIKMRPAVCPFREDLKDEDIRSLYESGQSTVMIAKKLQTCPSAVLKRLENMGISRRSIARPRMKFNETEAVCLYMNGYTFKEIGKRFGVNPTTISNRFDMLGLDRQILGNPRDF